MEMSIGAGIAMSSTILGGILLIFKLLPQKTPKEPEPKNDDKTIKLLEEIKEIGQDQLLTFKELSGTIKRSHDKINDGFEMMLRVAPQINTIEKKITESEYNLGEKIKDAKSSITNNLESVESLGQTIFSEVAGKKK